MYTQAAFQEDRPDLQHALIRDYPLGTLIATGGAGVTADLIPFILYPDEGARGVLRAHVARGNPVLEALRAGSEVLVVFQGEDAYVSPSWYATKAETHKVVPTWNYAMVQVRGRPRVVDDGAWLRRVLDDLTDKQEAALPAPWRVAEAPAEFLERIAQAIIGIEIPVASIAGKWKMSQNRGAADRLGVIAGLRSVGRDGAAALVEATLPPGVKAA